MSFFISINYFRMLGTGRIKKVFSQDFNNNRKKMVINIKFAFTNVSFKHNSACVIQKWLRFERVIIVRLAYIS